MLAHCPLWVGHSLAAGHNALARERANASALPFAEAIAWQLQAGKSWHGKCWGARTVPTPGGTY